MTWRLISCDLDGTLLNPGHRVGDYTLAVLRALRQRGIELVLASGRHYRDVSAISALIGHGVQTISCNGAAVHDEFGEVVEMTSLEPECLEFLVSDPAFAPVHTNLFSAHEWLVERPEPSLLVYHEESGFSYREVDFRRLDHQPVLKVFYYGEHARLRELEDHIREHWADRVSTTFSLPFTLEAMAAGVSKGAALERICLRKGIDRSMTLAFGDGLNDIEMLRGAGTGIVMGNADPRLKAALPGHPVIGGNDEEAVARYLERSFADS